MTQCMVRPCVARRFRRPGGERSCINVSGLCLERMCSRPSWISARMRSNYRIGLDRAIWVTSVRMRREDRFSIVVSSSRRPRRVDYIINSSSFCGCSFVRAWRSFLRPGLRVQTGRAQGAVKAGRRAGLASRFHAARPRLDGPEHGTRITLDGTPSHRS